jgi:short-subunit dehydrogenase
MKDPSGFLKSYSAVVITGGSSGIGYQFVLRLLALKPELTVINLSRTKPEEDWNGLPVIHREVDLASPAQLDEASQWLADKCASNAPGKLLLINNSGFGSYGRFPSHELERQLDMVEVNIAAPLHIVGILLPEIKKRGGGIINMCSLAAFQPTPYMATYGATKVFLLNWSLALGQELKLDGIQVLAVCPGPTKSQFFKNAGFATPPGGSIAGSGNAADVVTCALQAYSKAKVIAIPGWRNKLVAISAAFMSRKRQASTAEFILRKLRLESFLKHS